jgi:hypothetical protein
MTPLQQHHQQRPATEQSMLGQQAVKAAEQQAKRSVKTESASDGTISERQPRNRNRNPQLSSSKIQANEQAPEVSHVSEHPYKGKHIDFMG